MNWSHWAISQAPELGLARGQELGSKAWERAKSFHIEDDTTEGGTSGGGASGDGNSGGTASGVGANEGIVSAIDEGETVCRKPLSLAYSMTEGTSLPSNPYQSNPSPGPQSDQSDPWINYIKTTIETLSGDLLSP